MILGFISAAIVLCIMKAFVTDYYKAKEKNITVHPEQEVDDIESCGQHSTSSETPQLASHSIHPILEESEASDMRESSSESVFDPFAVLGEISSESSFAGLSDGGEAIPEDIESQDPIMRQLFSLTNEELRRGTAVMRLVREIQELYGDEE